jgi:hypothetical protein
VYFSKHYTLAEAQALLPQVRTWLDALELYQARLRAIEERVAPLLARHDDVGGELANDLVRHVADCKGILHGFAVRQIQIKDLARGLIDFPSLRHGREVFLCWEKEEDDIEYWHDIDTGYAGREPL